MTRLRVPGLLAVLVAGVLFTAPASALDIDAGAFFGNLGFPWAGETPLPATPYPADQWLYGGTVAFSQEFGDGLALHAEYRTDTVLHHIVSGMLTYKTGFASISAGPMLGTLNTAQTPLKAGIGIGFRLEAPGLVFFSAQADSSMGAGLVSVGDYSQERSELSAGWYVYNAICTVSMQSRRYTRILDSGDALVDASTAYTFSVDVNRKGAPYRVLVDLGYQDWTRTYPGTAVDGLGALVLGAQLSADVSPALTLVFGLDSGVYMFGTDALLGYGPAATSFMFSATAGCVIHLGAMPSAD